MRRRLATLLIPFALVSLLAAGCGGDDDNADKTTTTTAAQSSTSTTESESDDTTDDGSVDPSTTDGSGGSTTAPSAGEDHEFCDELGRVQAEFAGMGDDPTIEDTRASIATIVGILDEITPDAPDDLADALGGYADQMEQAQTAAENATSQQEFEDDVDELFNDEEASANGQVIGDWVQSNCPSLSQN